MTIWQYWRTRDKAEPTCHFQLWWANRGWLPPSHPVTLLLPLLNRTERFLSIGCSPSGTKLPLVWVLPGPWFRQGIKSSTGCSILLQCGPLHRQQGNLCSSSWSISLPPSPALVVSGLFLTLSPAPYNPGQHFFFLTYIFTEVLHMCLTGSATCCSGSTKGSCVWHRAASGLSSQKPPLQPSQLPALWHLCPAHQPKSILGSATVWLKIEENHEGNNGMKLVLQLILQLHLNLNPKCRAISLSRTRPWSFIATWWSEQLWWQFNWKKLVWSYDQGIKIKEVEECFHSCFFQDFLHYLIPSSIVHIKLSSSVAQEGYNYSKCLKLNTGICA